jgi:hypothetical protein
VTARQEAPDLSLARAATPALARWRGVVYLLLLLLAIALVRYTQDRSVLAPDASAHPAAPPH